MEFRGYDTGVGGQKVTVFENGQERELNPRLDEVNHSPDGFQWGYGGSGPAQLAYAMLRELYNEETTLDHYQDFKSEVISQLEGDWVLDEDRVREHVGSVTV